MPKQIRRDAVGEMLYQEAYNRLYSRVVEAALYLHNAPVPTGPTELARDMLVGALKDGEEVFKEYLFQKIQREKPPPDKKSEIEIEKQSSPA